MRLDKLASPSALEFIAAATPSSLPSAATGAAIAAIAAASAAVMFIYNIYENYEAKKHAAEIAVIEQLYEEYLAKITIHDCNIVVGFPPIFQKNADGEYQSMRMTDAQVKSIAQNALRAPTDIDLVTYHHHIICAIAALKKYYFLHTDKTSLTVQVVLYLINITEKLLQFEGYAFDIAYLNALCNFICNYASRRGENSEHFTCLNPVFRHLEYARQKLIRHKETRSQAEMIGELRGTCNFYIDRAIRALAKFSIPYTEWQEIDCCDPYALRNSIYALEYKKRIVGPATWTYNQKTLPEDCSLTNLIRRLTRFYLETIDPSQRPTIPMQNTLFIGAISESVIENIYQIFEAHTDVNPLTEPTRKIIITTLSQFAQLIHSIISFLYFLNELTKTIRNLGAIEMDNPAHCRRMYTLHEKLSDQIQLQAENIGKSLREINLKNNHEMRMAEKECFLRDLIKMLDEIRLTIDGQSDAISERRKAFNKKQSAINQNEGTREHMANVVNQIQLACNISLTLSESPATPSNDSVTNNGIRPPARVPRVIRQPTFIRNPQIIAQPNEPTGITTQPVAEIQTRPFPKTYIQMYDTAKTKSGHTNLQLLHLMLDMMNDYTKNNSRTLRVLHGSLWHHHIDDASKFAENLREKILNLTVNTDDATRPLLLIQLQLLSEISKKSDTNKSGSFATRVAFIVEKCAERGILLQPNITMPTAAQN